MTCHEAKVLISAYQDGELSADRRADVEEHLGGCGECSLLLKSNLQVSQAIREQAPTYAAPPSLLESTSRIARPRLSWRPFGAGVLAGLAASLALMGLFYWRAARDLTGPLVSDHIRSLMANHLFDIPSSDRHTVKPWFLGKLDFAPTVPDLSADGFSLVGGRLDYVDGRSAAALVYRKQQHVINVLVLPERSGETGGGEVSGYRVEHWTIGDLGYWAVSDVAREDLTAFARAFRRRAQ